MNAKQRDDLLKTLQSRFEKNMNRHKGIEWAKVQEKLAAHTGKLSALNEMEATGGEPDVVGFDKKTGEFVFLIARPKALKDAEVFVLIARGWNRAKNTGRKITHWIWPLRWELNC